ncbi:hypothetical protein BDV96DRAFT_594156 [Lophiotrema nucula]|uniref:Uncharacterized protein n=1 Tax=Lophiotrema nucula TaxID=690887 RepID=A0A6A5ZTU0_9PLEO|nr:hypothetical protein BDV96DRAFT_594156 [Lophiotrema nucula]
MNSANNIETGRIRNIPPSVNEATILLTSQLRYVSPREHARCVKLAQGLVDNRQAISRFIDTSLSMAFRLPRVPPTSAASGIISLRLVVRQSSCRTGSGDKQSDIDCARSIVHLGKSLGQLRVRGLYAGFAGWQSADRTEEAPAAFPDKLPYLSGSYPMSLAAMTEEEWKEFWLS